MMPISRILQAGLLFVILVALSLPARADLQLSYRVEMDTVKKTGGVYHNEYSGRILLSEAQARLDTGTVLSYVVDLDSRTMQVFDHKARTFEKVALPLDLDALISKKITREFAELKSFLAPKYVDEEVAPAPEIAGKWKSLRHSVSGANNSGDTFEYETWMTSEMSLSEGMQKTLRSVLRNYHELNPSARQWIDRALARSGIPVRIRSYTDDARTTREETWILQEASEAAVDPGLFQPPPEYTEKPFDVTRFVNIVTAPPPS